MATYSVFVMDYLVVDAEDEQDARQQARGWFAELLERGDVTWDIVEGDASELDDEDDEAD
ncbi:MAG: hypothetical protein ACM3S1_16630 [Hyphomicrobiales bacterium]